MSPRLAIAEPKRLPDSELGHSFSTFQLFKLIVVKSCAIIDNELKLFNFLPGCFLSIRKRIPHRMILNYAQPCRMAHQQTFRPLHFRLRRQMQLLLQNTNPIVHQEQRRVSPLTVHRECFCE